MEENKDGVTEAPDSGKDHAPSQAEKYTEAEKAAFNLKKQAEKAKEAGLDPADILGIRPQIYIDETLPDDRPLTIKDFRDLQKQDAHKSALQMAEELPEDERDEVKTLLENRIVPSGNAEEDLRLARAAVNARKNAQIVEHISNRTSPKQTAAGGSANAPEPEDQFTPTPEEAVLMAHPYNLSQEKIIAARKRAQK